MDKILKKMWALSNSMPKLTKDQKVSFGKTRYNYFNIENMIDELKPHLDKLNIAVFQPLSSVEGRPAIRTMLIDLDSNEVFESTYPMPDFPDSQKQGGAITYFRRYSLLSTLFLATEEDADSQKNFEQKTSNKKIKQDSVKVNKNDLPLPF